MIKKFQEYIKKEGLFDPQQKVLLTISGGIDSIVMADLFHKSGYNFGIAHCNFQLRGLESEKDLSFVKSLGEKYKVPFYYINFETEVYARDNGISVQMAARDLRYSWFNELMNDEAYDCFATAHHLDDQVETFFINLLRGTGISGLHGINKLYGGCIRPLLFATRYEIEEYQSQFDLSFREDLSNKSSKYLRNRIRHYLLPVFEDINPDFRRIFRENFERIRDVERIYSRDVESKRNNIVSEVHDDGSVQIPLDALINLHPLKTYLHEFLSPFNFNTSVIEDIVNALDDISGKQFYSTTHRLLKDRDHIIIKSLDISRETKEFYLDENCTLITEPVELVLLVEERDENHEIPTDALIACLDLYKLSFPLVLRRWQMGDYFMPLGMDNMKKLSDFFIDEKFSLFEKESTWILQSGKKICWIIGHRIDDRFKVTPTTKRILKLMLVK